MQSDNTVIDLPFVKRCAKDHMHVACTNSIPSVCISRGGRCASSRPSCGLSSPFLDWKLNEKTRASGENYNITRSQWQLSNMPRQGILPEIRCENLTD